MGNFWSDWVKGFAEGVTEAITGGFASFGAGTLSRQAAPYIPPKQEVKPGEPPVQDLGTALYKQARGQALTAASMATPYRRYVAPTITTQILKNSQNSPYYGNKEAAQEAAKYISPGQATLLGGANLVPGIQDIEKIDWRNPQDVIEYFDSNRAASIGSGIFDFSYNIAGDPFILAGGGWAALRRNVIVNPIKNAAQAEKVATLFQRAAQGEDNAAKPYIDKVMKAESAADLAWGAPERDASTMKVLDSLFKAKEIAGEQGVADVYSVAFGNRTAYDRLTKRSEVLKSLIDSEIEVSSWITQQLDTPIGQLQFGPSWTKTQYDSYFAQSAKIVDDLKKEFDWLDGVIKGEIKPQEVLDNVGKTVKPDPTGLFGVMANRSIPKWKWASNLQAEADLARAKAYLDNTIFQSPNGVRMRMVSWLSQGGMISELPPGWLKVGAATSQQSHKDVMALIQRAADDIGKQKDGAWKRAWFDSYLSLTDKAQRNEWVKRFDRSFTEEALIKELDIDPTNTKKLQAARLFAEFLEAQHAKAKAGALSRFVKNKYVTIDNEGLPTIAPQLAKALENTNLSKADLEGTPLLESQIADVIPLMDTRMMSRIIKENKEKLKLIVDSDIEEYLKGNKLEAALKELMQQRVAKSGNAKYNEFLDTIENTMDKIYSFWKPLTLLRLGYTQRNIFEGAARVVGLSMYLPYLYGSNAFSFLKDTASSSAKGVALGPKNYIGGKIAKRAAKEYQKFSPAARLSIQKIEGQINLGFGSIARLERDANQLRKLLSTQGRAKVRDLRNAISSRLDISDKDLNEFEKALYDFADSAPGAKDYITIGEILTQRVLNARNQQSVLNTIDGIVEDVTKFTQSINEFLQLRGNGTTPQKLNAELRSLNSRLNKLMNIPPKFKKYEGLIKEAKQYKTFDEFKKAFNVEIKHGQYYHFTDDPNFTIDKLKGPRDMSSLAGEPKPAVGNLMITSDFDNWNNYYNAENISRPYVAIIDMSDAPRESFSQVNRGFGNEFFINSNGTSKAKVVSVLPVKEAKKLDVKYKKDLPKNENELRSIWDAVNKNFNRTEVKDLQNLIAKNKRDRDLLNPKLMSNTFVKSGVKLSAVELEALKKLNQVYTELSDSWTAIRDFQKNRLAIIDDMAKLSQKATFEKEYSARPFMVEGQMVPSAADGVLGDIMYKVEASGAQTARNYFNSDSIQNSFMASTMRTASWKKIDPSDVEWYDSMVYYVNEQIRRDSVAMKILSGADDKNILAWFNTKEGKRYLSVNRNAVQTFGGGSKSEFLNWIRATVEKTVPQFSDSGINLRQKLYNNEFTIEDIMKFPEKLRSSVPGIELVPGQHTLHQRWNEVVNWLFKYLGSLPEDTLLRHPFYDAVYKMEMRRLAKLWKGSDKDFGPTDYARFGNQAHARALKTLNESLFTIQRYSDPAQFLKFVSPFYSASQNSQRFWLGRAFENPALPAIGLQIWNAPNKAFEVYDSNNNNRKIDSSFPFAGANEQVWITVPEKVAKALGIGDQNVWKLSKNSALSIMLNADNPFLPSMAWPVSFPASELFKGLSGTAFDPDKILKSLGFPGRMIRSVILPGGQVSSRGLVETVAPQNPIEIRFRRLIQTLSGRPDQQASNRIAALNKKKFAELAFEGRPMTPTVAAEIAKESTKEVVNGLVLETIFAAVLPVSSSLGTDWELMQSEYNKYTKNDPLLGSTNFAKDYGNIIGSLASGSLSRNVYGIKSNSRTVRNIKKWGSFAEKAEGYTGDDESLVGSLVNTDPSDFSQVAYQALNNMRIGGKLIRTKATPSEQIEKDDINLGWSFYIPASQEIDDMVRLGKINDQQASAAKRAITQVIASQHPYWYNQKKNFDAEGDQNAVNFIYFVSQNKQFINDAKAGQDYRADLWTALADGYIPFREGIVQILQMQKAKGGSADINAKSNAQVRASVDQFIQLLTDQYPPFGEFYQRHLYNDKFIPVTANLGGTIK